MNMSAVSAGLHVSNLDGVVALVSEEMKVVEARLAERMESPIGSIPQVGAHLLGAGGKRLRPLLAVLAARATGAPLEHARRRRLRRRADPHRDAVPRRRGRRRAGAARPARGPHGVRQRRGRPGRRLLPGARAGDRGADRIAGDGPVAGDHRHRDGRGRGRAARTRRQPRRHRRGLLPRHRSQDRVADRLVRARGRLRRRRAGGAARALRARAGARVPDRRRRARQRDRRDDGGQVGGPRPAGGQADAAGAAGVRGRPGAGPADPQAARRAGRARRRWRPRSSPTCGARAAWTRRGARRARSPTRRRGALEALPPSPYREALRTLAHLSADRSS